MKTVLSRSVLNVVDKSGVGQQISIFVDAINGILEGQLGSAVFSSSVNKAPDEKKKEQKINIFVIIVKVCKISRNG